MRWTTSDIPNQAGRTVLVTGANSGLGLRTSEALATAGAHVLMACRNQEKAAAAREEVAKVATGAEPEVIALDLADLKSVQECAAGVDRLDVLINNGGVMAIPHRVTADGFEMQFGTNHLGHFALTGLLMPVLLRSASPRVVTVSSIMHYFGWMRWQDLNWDKRYMKWPAYSQSKLANLLFTSELARRAQGTPLIAAAAHPGYASTNLQGVGPEMAGNRFMAAATDAANSVIGQSDRMGALPSLRAAVASDVRPNDYYGPSGPLPGPLALRGYPKKVGRSPLAKRAADAARLWERSEELTGVTYAWVR